MLILPVIDYIFCRTKSMDNSRPNLLIINTDEYIFENNFIEYLSILNEFLLDLFQLVLTTLSQTLTSMLFASASKSSCPMSRVESLKWCLLCAPMLSMIKVSDVAKMLINADSTWFRLLSFIFVCFDNYSVSLQMLFDIIVHGHIFYKKYIVFFRII